MVREEERIFNDPRFWASSFLRKEIRRENTLCTYAQLHAKTLQTVLPKTLYPNPNPTEIPLPQP